MLKAESDPQNPIPSDKGVKKNNESVSAYGFQFPEDSGVFREILERDYTVWLKVVKEEEYHTSQTVLMPTGYTIKKLFNVKRINLNKLIAGRKYESFQFESDIPGLNLNVTWDSKTINETENKLVLTTDGKVTPIAYSLEHTLTLEGRYVPQYQGNTFNFAEGFGILSVSVGSIESPVKALNDSVTIPMDEFTKIFTLDLPKKGDRDYAGYELDDISVKLNGEDAEDAFEITVENGGVFLKPLRALYQAQFQFTFTITKDEEGYPDIVDEIPVTVTAFGNPFLSGLTINEGTLSPAFAEDTYSYTALVGNSTSSLTVTPTAQDATANITVNGAEVASGNASSAIPLSVGNNTINIVVTTKNGNTKTYSIVVTRAEAESPYISRTLTDTRTGITVSGSIHSGSAIVVEDMVLHPEGSCTACDTIRNTQDENQLILGCNISLTMGFSGPLTVSLPVGSQYNGRTVTILHCMNDSLETITATVSDGMAIFTVTSLSPFAVFDLAEETDPDNLPVVVTNTITDINASGATFNGTVSNAVAYEVTERGFFYKTSSSDGDEIKVVAQGNGAGSFSAAVNGLEPNTTYYVRAYVKNAAGTFYGETVSFRTAEANPASSPLTGDKRTSSSLMVLAVGVAAGIAVLIWRRRRAA